MRPDFLSAWRASPSMFLRSRRKPSPDSTMAQQALLAFSRVRDHWSTCDECRRAAAESASLWCEAGLGLMKSGVAEHRHWDDCVRCKEAQERVQAAQCSLGRELEREYRALARRLAEA
jgi:hypothetical protein